MKNLKGFASFVLVAFVSIFVLGFGGVREAGASVSGNFSFGGFYGNYYGEETDGGLTGVGLYLATSSHSIDKVGSSFYTDGLDPSEGYGWLYITGSKDMMSRDIELQTGSGITIGDVTLLQYGWLSSGGNREDAAGAGLYVAPFNLYHAFLSYGEYTYSPGEDEPDVTRYSFELYFRGSFGPGALGDRLGAPFVPTPGTAGLAFAAGLCALRRRR